MTRAHKLLERLNRLREPVDDQIEDDDIEDDEEESGVGDENDDEEIDDKNAEEVEVKDGKKEAEKGDLSPFSPKNRNADGSIKKGNRLPINDKKKNNKS